MFKNVAFNGLNREIPRPIHDFCPTHDFCPVRDGRFYRPETQCVNKRGGGRNINQILLKERVRIIRRWCLYFTNIGCI